jgi:hypothetical protein
MTYRTVLPSCFDEYLASDDDSVDERRDQEEKRNERLSRFPHSVMLKVSFPECDFANRWCWQHFGPNDGECADHHSEYRVCERTEPHSHVGKWTSHWFVKTDYDFGFNEWYFSESADRELFLANLDNINWGEHYPK